MVWVAIAFVVGVAIAAGVVNRKSDGFTSAASTLGLKLSRTVPDLLPRLEGMTNGLAVRAEVLEDATAVRYCVFYPALGLSLRLQRETDETRRLGPEVTGDRDIGDTSFDRTFRVNTSRPDALRKMLSNDLRRHLLALSDKYPEAIIADGDITYTARGADPDAGTIVETIQDFVAAAHALVKARPPELVKPQPRPPVATPPPAKAEAKLQRPQEPVVAQPDPTPGSVNGTEQPAPSSPPPTPEPAAKPRKPASGLPDGFFDKVFGANRMSFEDEAEFDLSGREVNLSGTVKQASTYSDRTEFSPTSGTKAVVTVAQIETDLYGLTDIDAVVYLHGRQELERGEAVAFRGTLDGVDAFMRNVFVSDARLTDA